MRRKYGLKWCLLVLCMAGSLLSPLPPVSEANKSEKFSALAVLPSGAGRRMVGAGSTANVDIYINSYTSDADAKQYANLLLGEGGGSNALLKGLEKAEAIGKVSLSRRVGFFDLKLIRSRPTENGRRIVGVCDRPVQFLEAYGAGRSMDYTFGIVILNLKTNSKGKEEGVGELIYAAKIKVLEGNNIEIENYGVQPAKLQGVRKL